MTCKTEITVIDIMILASMLKLVRSSNDKIENNKRHSICLVKSVNIPIEKESLVFIEEYMGGFSCSNDALCCRVHLVYCAPDV